MNKIQTEALWNELILSKFSKKVKINEDNLKKKIISTKSLNKKSYLMSEIVFNISKNDELEKKYNEIVEEIDANGFDNAALKHSISETANIGGRLDWIDENSLNINIIKKLNLLKINEFTKPIQIPSGFIILKINDIKKTKSNKNLEIELKN